MPTADPLYDLAALGRTFEEYRPRLEAIVRRRLDPAIGVRLPPEELLSEAYLDARRKWADYQAAGRPVSAFVWLYGIVRDRLIEEYRKATRACRDARRDVPWPEETTLQLGLRLALTSDTPSRAAVREETARLVRAAVDQLSDSDRDVILMHDFDGLTFADIGERLGEKANTVNVRYVRAVRRLKVLLAGPLGGSQG